MATGGYRSRGGPGGSTTDFLEEWKAKREKMRSKQGQLCGIARGPGAQPGELHPGRPPAPAAPGPWDPRDPPGDSERPDGGDPPSPPGAAGPVAMVMPPSSPRPGRRAGGLPPSSPTAGSRAPGAGGVAPKAAPPLSPKAGSRAAPGASGANTPAPPSSPTAGSRAGPGAVNAPAPPSPPRAGGQPTLGDREGRDGAKDKGKSSGPSARKGKGQIEKRKLREKRRSTGVVNIPAAEHLDEYEDDEAGQKERKREDAITQENTIKNEASASEPGGSSLETSRPFSRSRSITGEDDVSGQHCLSDRSGSWGLNRDSSTESLSILEKKIEILEKNVIAERKENLRLQKLIEDKEETIGKLKEEINLLNRDLDDTEDENEQLKQENKTLLKVVGQLTR
ncbi:PRKC apoptosis WT1 regulator protein [Macrotis lagotis]|uniref:PRKC apoptosis WT1 regulator protein n=1 Tax=Macrotis lagotis TaxID=92651 RepID=UPI003D694925